MFEMVHLLRKNLPNTAAPLRYPAHPSETRGLAVVVDLMGDGRFMEHGGKQVSSVKRSTRW